MEKERIWTLLQHADENHATRRAYLIHHAALGLNPQVLIQKLQDEQVDAARRALILCLGEFTTDQLPQERRLSFLDTLAKLSSEDPDPGVHSAAEWMLRRWRFQAKLQELDRALVSSSVQDNRRWYVNRFGHTMVVIPDPRQEAIHSVRGRSSVTT